MKPRIFGSSLLYRGRHTSATAMAVMLSLFVGAVAGQTTTPIQTIPSPGLTNPGPLTLPPAAPLVPAEIGLVGGLTTEAPVPPPSTITGTRMNALGLDFAASVNGSLWAVGNDFAVWQNGPKGFVRMPNPTVGAMRITVTPEGVAWIADVEGGIWSFDVMNRVWTKRTGSAVDIASGADGSVWIVSSAGAVQKWSGTAFENKATAPDASARRIAVDPFGRPWLMGPAGGYRHNGTAFEKLPFAGLDIAIGGDGAAWVPAAEGKSGRLQWWNGETLVRFGGQMLTHVSVDGVGMGYGIDASSQAYSFSLPGPVQMMSGIKSRGWFRLDTPGKVICSSNVSPNDCGRAIAAWVGKHEVKMNCSSGFYDPIWGGSCWKCPDDDGSGPWIRSLDSITSNTACWRSPKETFSAAIKVKSPGWSWQCPDGSFWDGYSPDGAGGSCWRCPDSHPRRTGHHIKENNACVTASNQTRTATMLSYLGCPEPNRDTMGLAGATQPGRPFLDVGAGGCFACPVVDKNGQFLISSRNGVALYKQDPETDVPYTSTKTLTQGCDIAFRWQPKGFTQPGLSGLNGALEMIMEARLFEYPELMTGMLYALADAKELSGADATKWVTESWKQMATNPLSSSALRSVVFMMMRAAAKKEPARRTAAENNLLQAFGRYIVERRSYYAQNALEMYDGWKAQSDAFQASIAKSPPQQAFSFGVVPFDFKNTMLSIAGVVGGAAISTIGMTAAYDARESLRSANLDRLDILEKPSSPSSAVENATRSSRTLRPVSSTRALDLPKAMNAVRGFSMATTSILSTMILIEIAAGIILGIAAAQLAAIESARPELLQLLDQARQPVDVVKLVSTDEGRAQALLYWGQATDTGEEPIAGLTTMAANANKWAAARKYSRPRGI